MDDHENSYTQELSRGIDFAYAEYRSAQGDREDELYDALLAQANNVVSYRLQQRDTHLARDITRRAMMALPDFRGDSKLSTWFYRIAQNEVNRALAEVTGERETSVPIEAHFGTGPNLDASDSPELQEEAQRKYRASKDALPAKIDVEKHKRKLPLKQAAIVALNLEGYSLEEIAEKTGEPIGTIRSRYRLAKNKMASRIKKK